jgi:hypothetical protein
VYTGKQNGLFGQRKTLMSIRLLLAEQNNDTVKAQQNIWRHLIFLFGRGSQANPKDNVS